jgi:hypothetical protein
MLNGGCLPCSLVSAIFALPLTPSIKHNVSTKTGRRAGLVMRRRTPSMEAARLPGVGWVGTRCGNQKVSVSPGKFRQGCLRCRRTFCQASNLHCISRAGAGTARWIERNPAACSPQTTGIDVLPVSSIISSHTAARRRRNRTAVGKEEKKKTMISCQSPVRNCSACC